MSLPDTPIELPKVDHPKSALDGYALMAIDTDPDEMIGASVASLQAQGLEVLAVFRRKLRGRDGYVVLTFNKKAVKR